MLVAIEWGVGKVARGDEHGGQIQVLGERHPKLSEASLRISGWTPGERPTAAWREKLRRSGRCVDAVAVAWEQKLLDRAGRRVQSRAATKMSDDENESLMLRQAIANADWDTVECHGGLDSVVDKINLADEETAALAGAGMTDDFRLRGSRTWRHMRGPLTKEGCRT